MSVVGWRGSEETKMDGGEKIDLFKQVYKLSGRKDKVKRGEWA